MKKSLIMFAAMAVAVSFTSCKSSESAYKKAYEKAKAAEEKAGYVTETTSTIEETTTYVPTVEKQNSYTETPVQTYQSTESVPTRQESYSMIDGEGLKAYSIVVGSFGVKANAERLQSSLRGQGYNAQIVRTANNLYRVVAASSDSMSDIVSDKNRLKSSYADAWILRK
ncbi:MAG: SPOR domain-containing protein [Bacteroidaceae bacterium]|nr:SPOR domain-containing protein [Bacteroidaceae bacterium]